MIELLPEVARFLSASPLKGVVGGKDVAAADGATFSTLDPGSGEKPAEVASMQARDVDAAVKAAANAFTKSGWLALPANERAVWSHRLADEIERRKKIIGQIEALDAGKIREQAEGDVHSVVRPLV